MTSSRAALRGTGRRRRLVWVLASAVLVAIAIQSALGCDSSDLVIGDDTPLPSVGDGGGGLFDVVSYDPTADALVDVRAVSPDAWDVLDASDAATTCPTLSPPGPTFCDGGPYAAIYETDGCIKSFACAPVACTDAGGKCVGLAPGSCPNNHFGAATTYSCGGGIGVGCCLP